MFVVFCNFVLLLSTGEAVVTSEPPTAADNVKLVSLTIANTVPVNSSPVLSVNIIVSPTINSVVNFVPCPIILALLFATLIVPVKLNCESSVEDVALLVNTVSAVNPGVPA